MDSYIFYLAGSICFAIGSILAIADILRKLGGS